MIEHLVDCNFESVCYLPSVLQRKEIEACWSVVQELLLFGSREE